MVCRTCARPMLAISADAGDVPSDDYCSMPCFRFGTMPERFLGLTGYDAILSIVYDPWELGDIGWP